MWKHLHFLLFHRVLFGTHAAYLLISSSDTASFYFHILSTLFCMLGHQIQILACGSFVKRCWNLSRTLLCHPLTLPSFLSPFFIDDRTCVIFPLVKAFCEKCFKGDEAVLASLSFQYGKLCHGLSGDCPLPFYVFLKCFKITVHESWHGFLYLLFEQSLLLMSSTSGFWSFIRSCAVWVCSMKMGIARANPTHWSWRTNTP